MNETQRTRLYEPGWQYVPAAHTNIRARFDAIRAQQKQAKPSNVQPLRKTK